jgi:trigger factor
MKRKIKVVISLLCLTILLGGWSSKDSVKEFGYDLSQYVTVHNYKGIKYKPESKKVTDEEIQTRILEDLNSIKIAEQITDRPVKDGDMVNIDYEGYKDGIAIEGGSAQGYDLIIGSGTFIDGFEDQLIGAQIGETKSIQVTFPKNYAVTELAGKETIFKVKINSISEMKVPELTDETVKKINKNYNSVDEYKTEIKAELTKQKKEAAIDQDRSTIWKKVLKNAKIKKYPTKELKKHEKMYRDIYNDYAKQMNIKLSDILQEFGMTQKEFDQTVKTYAKNSVADELVYEYISLNENIKITNKEYKKLIPEYVKKFNASSEKEMLRSYGKDVIREYMLRDKVIDYVIAKAVPTK